MMLKTNNLLLLLLSLLIFASPCLALNSEFHPLDFNDPKLTAEQRTERILNALDALASLDKALKTPSGGSPFHTKQEALKVAGEWIQSSENRKKQLEKALAVAGWSRTVRQVHDILNTANTEMAESLKGLEKDPEGITDTINGMYPPGENKVLPVTMKFRAAISRVRSPLYYFPHMVTPLVREIKWERKQKTASSGTTPCKISNNWKISQQQREQVSSKLDDLFKVQIDKYEDPQKKDLFLMMEGPTEVFFVALRFKEMLSDSLTQCGDIIFNHPFPPSMVMKYMQGGE